MQETEEQFAAVENNTDTSKQIQTVQEKLQKLLDYVDDLDAGVLVPVDIQWGHRVSASPLQWDHREGAHHGQHALLLDQRWNTPSSWGERSNLMTGSKDYVLSWLYQTSDGLENLIQTVKLDLRNRGVEFSLCFPTILKVKHIKACHWFNTPEEA